MRRSDRVREGLVHEHWQLTAHRVVVRTDGHASCAHCQRAWQLRDVEPERLAALAERVDGDLVTLTAAAAE